MYITKLIAEAKYTFLFCFDSSPTQYSLYSTAATFENVNKSSEKHAHSWDIPRKGKYIKCK